MFSQSIGICNWYHFIMIIPVVSSHFTIVSTAKAYAISLEGFEFGDEFLQIASLTHLLTSPHASSVSASKLTNGDESSHFIVSKAKWEMLLKNLKCYQSIVLRKKMGGECDLYFRSCFSMCRMLILEKLSLLRCKWPQREMELR